MQEQQITEPGIYSISSEAYHGDPAPAPSLSSSIIKKVVGRSPIHAAIDHPRLATDHRPTASSAFDLGKAAHSFLTKDPEDFVVVPFDDWRKKAAKEMRDEARERGAIPMLEADFEKTSRMVSTLREQLVDHSCSDAFNPAAGECEQSLFWIDDHGVWGRCRPDHMTTKTDGLVIYDYKTTSLPAIPSEFSRNIWRLRYDIQAAWYMRGAERVLGVVDPVFRFVVQETAPPFACCVMELSGMAIKFAQKDLERAVAVWSQCLASGVWPGYRPLVHVVDYPAWMRREIEGRENREPVTETLVQEMLATEIPL